MSTSPRKTQRIPREQRKRKKKEFSLGPEALEVLAGQENASRYVERAVLELAARESRVINRKPR